MRTRTIITSGEVKKMSGLLKLSSSAAKTAAAKSLVCWFIDKDIKYVFAPVIVKAQPFNLPLNWFDSVFQLCKHQQKPVNYLPSLHVKKHKSPYFTSLTVKAWQNQSCCHLFYNWCKLLSKPTYFILPYSEIMIFQIKFFNVMTLSDQLVHGDVNRN